MTPEELRDLLDNLSIDALRLWSTVPLDDPRYQLAEKVAKGASFLHGVQVEKCRRGMETLL